MTKQETGSGATPGEREDRMSEPRRQRLAELRRAFAGGPVSEETEVCAEILRSSLAAISLASGPRE